MVRRMSTVRFRKEVPGDGVFSNIEQGTLPWRVALEWHSRRCGDVLPVLAQQPVSLEVERRRASPVPGTREQRATPGAYRGRLKNLSVVESPRTTRERPWPVAEVRRKSATQSEGCPSEQTGSGHTDRRLYSSIGPATR